MVCPERPFEKFMIHRIAKAFLRSGRTSTGTWYVAPPTRRLFTSTRGRTFSIAYFKNSERFLISQLAANNFHGVIKKTPSDSLFCRHPSSH